MTGIRARKTTWLLAALISVTTIGLAAQNPKPPVKPKPAAPAPKAPAPKPPEPPKPQQWKVVARYVADGVETLTTVYAGGKRQRVELPGGTAVITQCDLSRAVQVNDKARAYAIVPLAAPQTATPAATTPASKPGASVLVRTTATDTGERRDMFGMQARHLKLVTATEPSPQACDKKKGRVETDGWFADIPALQECAAAKAARAAVEPVGACHDPRVEERSGPEITGFPLAYSVVTFDGAGKELSRLTSEVTALTHEDLSAPLFEPPATFAALPDADALAAAARRVELEELGTSPKLAGMIRIGVAPAADRSGKSVSADTIRTQLLEDFSARPFEAVPLSSAAPEEQQAEARKKECDYLVRAELGSLTTSTPGKVGGLVRRASGGGTPTEIHEAGVSLELIPVAAAAARPKKLTASAKTGAFTWRRAVGLARFAGKLYFGMTGGMMTTLMNSAGGGGGGPMGGSDPTVNALMMMLGPSAGSEPSDDLLTPAAVVAAAFQKAAADVMKELQR